MNTTKTIGEPRLESEPAAPPRLRWEQCTVIRPRVDGDDVTHVEVSNGLLEKRVALSRRALLEFLGNDLYRAGGNGTKVRQRFDALGITTAAADEATLAGIDHWRQRNWSYSLPYYLWSGRAAMADAGPDAAEQQRRMLTGYIASSDPKPRYRTASTEGRRPLADPAPLRDEPLSHIFMRRRASFMLPKRTISEATLSGIFWYGLQTVRASRTGDPESDPTIYLRSFGSALDFYFVAYAVDGLAPGLYFYDAGDHVIELVYEGDLRRPMQISLNGQQPPMAAACTLIMSAEFQRYQWRYRHERALRELYVDTGRIAHYVILAATSYNKSVHISPAVNDRMITSVLRRNPVEEQVLYTLSIS